MQIDVDKVREQAERMFLNGLHCSQIMLLLAQEMDGEEEPAVIRAVGGLAGGMAVGHNCGTLTGGACVLSSNRARGAEDEQDAQPYLPLVAALNEWFEDEFGSVNCCDLVSKERTERLRICPGIIAKTFAKCVQLLNDSDAN